MVEDGNGGFKFVTKDGKEVKRDVPLFDFS